MNLAKDYKTNKRSHAQSIDFKTIVPSVKKLPVLKNFEN
jgi:hypothetical protein